MPSLSLRGLRACFVLFVALLLVGGAACMPARTETGAAFSTEALTAPAVALAQGTPPTPPPDDQIVPTTTPEPTAGTPTPFTISVWWAEALAPLDNDTAAEALSEQLSAFQLANPDLLVDLRLKQVGDVGGIMSTLRTASAVAPGALPDLTLLRRDDLRLAARSGFIEPLAPIVAPALLADLPPAALQLGMVDGELYGLPYTLDVLHAAVAEDDELAALLDAPDPAPLTLALLEESGAPVTFMTNPGDVLVLQTQSPTTDADLLRDTLVFYQSSAEAGRVTTEGVTAWSAAPRGLALTSSTGFLDWTLRDGLALRALPVPTVSGREVTTLDGWMWVIVTADEERQAQAARLLAWLFDVERQRDYTRDLHMLPSQTGALTRYGDADYIAFIQNLLEFAIVPTDEGSAARALATAFAAVTSGQKTADQAARELAVSG